MNDQAQEPPFREWTCPHGTTYRGTEDFISGARNAHDEISNRSRIDNTDFPGQPHLLGRRGETISTSDEPIHVKPPPDTLEGLRQSRERQTDSWWRPLNDGRVEVMCKAPGFRIRVSAPEDQAWQAVEMFERWTNLVVQSDRRPPRVYAPPRGQMSMIELESGGNDGED